MKESEGERDIINDDKLSIDCIMLSFDVRWERTQWFIIELVLMIKEYEKFGFDQKNSINNKKTEIKSF